MEQPSSLVSKTRNISLYRKVLQQKENSFFIELCITNSELSV